MPWRLCHCLKPDATSASSLQQMRSATTDRRMLPISRAPASCGVERLGLSAHQCATAWAAHLALLGTQLCRCPAGRILHQAGHDGCSIQIIAALAQAAAKACVRCMPTGRPPLCRLLYGGSAGLVLHVRGKGSRCLLAALEGAVLLLWAVGCGPAASSSSSSFRKGRWRLGGQGWALIRVIRLLGR